MKDLSPTSLLFKEKISFFPETSNGTYYHKSGQPKLTAINIETTSQWEKLAPETFITKYFSPKESFN